MMSLNDRYISYRLISVMLEKRRGEHQRQIISFAVRTGKRQKITNECIKLYHGGWILQNDPISLNEWELLKWHESTMDLLKNGLYERVENDLTE